MHGKSKNQSANQKTIPNSPPSPAKLYMWEEGVKRTSVYVKGDVGNLKQFYACDLKTKHQLEMLSSFMKKIRPRELGECLAGILHHGR